MQETITTDNIDLTYTDDSNGTQIEGTDSLDTGDLNATEADTNESLDTGDLDATEAEANDSEDSDSTNESTDSFDTEDIDTTETEVDDSNSDDAESESVDSLYTGDTDVSEAEVSDSVFDDTTELDTQSDSYSDAVNVDDFGGDLQSAISAADEGDVVKLGNSTYYTSGVTIDKNIVLEGQEGTVIDGGGTSGTIINLNPGASNAIIREIEITNGNNGIYSYGASNLTIQDVDVNNIGINQTVRDGQNNTGIALDHADGSKILNSTIQNVGRKGVSIGDTEGATLSGLTVKDVNLAAQHSQAHDAAGVKFYNTHDVAIQGSSFSDINAINIWNDSTNATTIEGNVVTGVGEDFVAPSFNGNVEIFGIYNEKSSNATINNNDVTAVDGFLAFKATEFSTETMNLGSNNFSSSETNTTDFWVNESVEKLIATTPDPSEAGFGLFADDYYRQAVI